MGLQHMERERKHRETGQRIVYETYSDTIRQMPENYLLAARRPASSLGFFACPDAASPINSHSLGLALMEHPTHDDPDALAEYLNRSFFMPENTK